MRQLVVCCDGTWNSAGQSRDGFPTPTNVRLFYNLLQKSPEAEPKHVCRYFSGVGADGSALSRLFDGGTGHGLSRNIINAYLWLAQSYEDGDSIALVGFSRGAYTARSLAGMLTSCGLARVPNPPTSPPGLAWRTAERVFTRGYLPGSAARNPDWNKGMNFHNDFLPPHNAHARRSLGEKINFLGVWDTVGSLGIPNMLVILDTLYDHQHYAFHDTNLNAGIKRARHAIALDEFRGPFAPTLWTEPNGQVLQDGERAVQKWFPGCHCDVGGGYRESGLSDGALRWMLDEAKAAGLVFEESEGMVKGNPCDVLHNSCVGIYQRLSPVPRSTPRVCAGAPAVHESAILRSNDSPYRQDPYRRSIVLVAGAGSHTADVCAHELWCETGLYLDRGVYRFSATGEWVNKEEVAGPDGVDDPSFLTAIAYRAGSMLGQVEEYLAWAHKNPAGELPLTKRVEDAQWMQLVAVVANGGFHEDGSVAQHQILVLGTGPTEHTVEQSGYLYAFANDAWGMYSNNRGSVRLTVEKTATLD